MVRRKPLVFVTRKLPQVIETRMMELFDARLNDSDEPLSKAALIEAVKTTEVLVPTLTDRIDSSVLAHANPNFRLIANYGTGVDHIDVEMAFVLQGTLQDELRLASGEPLRIRELPAVERMATCVRIGLPERAHRRKR